jgi:eukaryotic-like serine/threonine-protein kinase
VQNREFYDGDLVPGTRYRVASLLGFGGMGTVYEVEHVELGRRFVLKALLRELARRQDLVQRLRNEWRALGRLEHPNIVSVTDAGTTPNGVPYYVMERLEGETLASRLRRVRRLRVPEALAIAAGVLEGLSAAHEIGVIHRDVKPPNIFLLHGDRPKVLDFGVAKIADAANVITARGVAVGTPRYMSPEQARGHKVDGRSDIYAVGLVLFEMIAGVGPYDDARDANEMLLAHLAREAPRLGSMVMGVLPEVDEILVRMLAKDPRSRPDSARALGAQLRAIIGDYALRVSTTGATPVAGYSEITVQTAPDSATRDLTTRPDGVAAGSGQSTAVEPPPSWQLTDQPSASELPTLVKGQGLPLPPQAYDESNTPVAALPSTTLVDDTGASLTPPHELVVVKARPGAPTVRYGSSDGLHDWSRADRTERLPENTAQSGEQVTRTRVPPAESPTLATPIPVVPSRPTAPVSRRRGLLGGVVGALIGVGTLAWFIGNQPAGAPGTVPAASLPAAAAPPVEPAAPQLPASPVATEAPAAPAPPAQPASASASVTPPPVALSKAPPVKRVAAKNRPPEPKRAAPPAAPTAHEVAPPPPKPASLLPASGL